MGQAARSNVCNYYIIYRLLLPAEVPSLATGSHRLIPAPFLVPSARAAMANVTIPMEDSVTFKKLQKKKAGFEGAPIVCLQFAAMSISFSASFRNSLCC